ncbi:MAG: PIN domain-containing protein [Dehalococcoidia bacterium]
MLIRYLTGLPMPLAEVSRDIINSDEELVVTDVVLAEAAFVLRSFYRVQREELVDSLVDFLSRHNLNVFRLRKDSVIEALELCRPSNRVSVADALIWAAARNEQDSVIYTLDRRFPTEGVTLKRSV